MKKLFYNFISISNLNWLIVFEKQLSKRKNLCSYKRNPDIQDTHAHTFRASGKISKEKTKSNHWFWWHVRPLPIHHRLSMSDLCIYVCVYVTVITKTLHISSVSCNGRYLDFNDFYQFDANKQIDQINKKSAESKVQNSINRLENRFEIIWNLFLWWGNAWK